MSFQDTHDLLQTVKDLQREITTERLNRYWPGFHVLPFALYDARTVYLANHPNPPADFKFVDGVHIGPGRSEFIANTSIEFAGERIGIWNLDYFDPFIPPEEVYAKIIHEMFHAYQERTELLKAAFAPDPAERRGAVSRFVAYREKRKQYTGDSLNYELGLETYEGTAAYVEYQALRDRSDLPEPFLLAQYGRDLAGYPKDLEGFRFTCYSGRSGFSPSLSRRDEDHGLQSGPGHCVWGSGFSRNVLWIPGGRRYRSDPGAATRPPLC